MMEQEFLEQFISLTTTKLTANVYTELSFLFLHQMLHVEANQARMLYYRLMGRDVLKLGV